jgi:predicted neuraminidase
MWCSARVGDARVVAILWTAMLAFYAIVSIGAIGTGSQADEPATGATEPEFIPPPMIEPGQGACVLAEFIYASPGRPTPECHASTIVETPNGLVASWFGGSYEKHSDVGIWVAYHEGGKWSAPVEVATGAEGETEDFPCWNPVLFQPQPGALLLFYKVGPSPREWWGLKMSSRDHGRHWSKPTRLGRDAKLGEKNPALLGPVKNKPIAVADGAILCPSSSEHDQWRVHLERTVDVGKSWEVIGPLDDPDQLQAIQPSLLTYGNGRLQILCRSKSGHLAQSRSRDNGATWEPLSATALPNPNSGTDAVTLSDGRQLLVYNHTQRSESGNGRHMLNVALSRDGETWVCVLTLENKANDAGYSYPAVIQTSDGMVHITYTYERELVRHVVLDPTKLLALQ